MSSAAIHQPFQSLKICSCHPFFQEMDRMWSVYNIILFKLISVSPEQCRSLSLCILVMILFLTYQKLCLVLSLIPLVLPFFILVNTYVCKAMTIDCYKSVHTSFWTYSDLLIGWLKKECTRWSSPATHSSRSHRNLLAQRLHEDHCPQLPAVHTCSTINYLVWEQWSYP